MNKNQTFAFFLGLGLGAAAGLLWAPSSGAKLRKSIADTVDQTAGAAKKQADDLWNSTTEVFESGAESLERTRQALKSAVLAGKQAYQNSASENV